MGKTFKLFESISNIFGSVQNILFCTTTLAFLAGGLFLYLEIKGAINFIGDTVTAVKNVSVDSVNKSIETTGKAVNSTIDTAKETYSDVSETVKEVGNATDKAVDNSIDWVGNKLNKWREATE